MAKTLPWFYTFLTNNRYTEPPWAWPLKMTVVWIFFSRNFVFTEKKILQSVFFYFKIFYKFEKICIFVWFQTHFFMYQIINLITIKLKILVQKSQIQQNVIKNTVYFIKIQYVAPICTLQNTLLPNISNVIYSCKQPSNKDSIYS